MTPICQRCGCGSPFPPAPGQARPGWSGFGSNPCRAECSPPRLNPSGLSILFRVRSGRHAVAGALVVVTRAGKAVTRGCTDARGQVILQVPRGSLIGVSALSTPANPNRAYVPVIRSMRSIVLTRRATVDVR